MKFLEFQQGTICIEVQLDAQVVMLLILTSQPSIDDCWSLCILQQMTLVHALQRARKSLANVLGIISSLGTHITKLSVPPPKLHPISKDIRFQCLLFHQMDIEFFAQILFFKILGPHELCLTMNDTFLEKLDVE